MNKQNRYKSKKFSILGDSISTLQGYNPPQYKVFYNEEKVKRTGVAAVQDTWWGKVIEHFEGELLVNNSWSGSRVTKLPNKERLFPSGCSKERTANLHKGDVDPDIIIVFMGINDWANGVPGDTEETRCLFPVYEDVFLDAYEMMIDKLQWNYRNAEIWCCTLPTSYIKQSPEFAFPYEYKGKHINYYNNIIRDVAKDRCCKLLDLYAHHIPYDSIDGSHPTKEGMDTISTLVIDSVMKLENSVLKDNEEENFIACVYASPDVIEMDSPDSFDEYQMDDIYPLNFAESAYTIKDSKLEKQLIDLDETMKICMQCGHGVPMTAEKCPFCGNILRIEVPPVPEPGPTLKPEVKQKPEPTPEKKGFFASLIGRFKK